MGAACPARVAVERRYGRCEPEEVQGASYIGTEIEELEQGSRDSTIKTDFLEALRGFDEIVEGMQATEEARIMVISYLEQFYTHLKVAIIFGLLFTFPLVLYEGWKFVGAGLYKNEQRYVLTFLPFSMILFAIGAAFGYLILIPTALKFLATWGPAWILQRVPPQR